MADKDTKKKGGISVDTEHIFPIIKKWLYSEREIFLREIVSNAVDAVTKHRRLVSLAEVEDSEQPYRVSVRIDKAAGTLTVSDNGIGMSADEVERYLCNMALSGALEFIEKYEDEGTNGIIGHFGLGFYSAFMVADTVEVLTRSFRDEPAVLFTAAEDGSYELSAAERDGRGTDVIMHINEDGREFLEVSRVREILDRYCAFMPVEIYLEDAESAEEGEPAPINDTAPLWQKNASDCTEEEYKAFYSRVFGDYREPLFHIHLAADYPLNFKGVLFFPRIARNFESLEGQIKLYYNQVFVADNIREVIPEYLLMLRGVIDCPELPLNVSRSYLQDSAYVRKVAAYIVKKVGDKLVSMMNTDREGYEAKWADLSTFVEYGCISDRKFYDRACAAVLNADNSVSVCECFSETDDRGFGIEPGMGLGRKLAESSYAALSEREACGDDRIVEILGIAHSERAESGEDLGPCLFIKTRGDKTDLNAHILEFKKEILDAFCWSECAFLASACHDLFHFSVSMLEIEISCLFK